jgi:hypothetical protein
MHYGRHLILFQVEDDMFMQENWLLSAAFVKYGNKRVGDSGGGPWEADPRPRAWRADSAAWWRHGWPVRSPGDWQNSVLLAHHAGRGAHRPQPALLHIEPARSRRNKHVMDAWMLLQPSARLQTGMTTQLVADDEHVTLGIVGFDVSQERDGAFSIAGGRAPGQFLPIADASGSINPRLLGSAAIIQLRFDAMPVGRPASNRGKGARHCRSEFVGAQGRRPVGWLGGVGDDRGPDCGRSPYRERFPNCACGASAHLHARGWCGSASV